MKLKLKINGEEKEFSQPSYLPAIVFKQSLIYAEGLEKDFSVEKLEEVAEFIATRLFASQFTVEEFWEGLDSLDFIEVLRDCLASPVTRISDKLALAKN
jgi:hypothetical protein